MRRLVVAFSIWNRKRKVALIQDFMRRHEVAEVIFVGCGQLTNPNEAIVEMGIAELASVRVACDIQEVGNTLWPYQQADGRDLPFPDQSVDMILANAVIEHVGDLADQMRFVSEQTRVARSWVITTPNRWFPVESHTSAIVRHWSRSWRNHRTEFSRLLSLSEFRDLLPANAVIHGHAWSPTFTALYSA